MIDAGSCGNGTSSIQDRAENATSADHLFDHVVDALTEVKGVADSNTQVFHMSVPCKKYAVKNKVRVDVMSSVIKHNNYDFGGIAIF